MSAPPSNDAQQRAATAIAKVDFAEPFFTKEIQKICDRWHAAGVPATQIVLTFVMLHDVVSQRESRPHNHRWWRDIAPYFSLYYTQQPRLFAELLEALERGIDGIRTTLKTDGTLAMTVDLEAVTIRTAKRLVGIFRYVTSGVYHESKRIPSGRPLFHKEIAAILGEWLGTAISEGKIKMDLGALEKTRLSVLKKWTGRLAAESRVTI